MAEYLPSPSSLFNQLTTFSYEQDPDFALGTSDAMNIARETKVATASLIRNDGEVVLLYDEKKITFSAERAHTEDDFRQPDKPNDFTIEQQIITQLPGIPKLLLNQLNNELAEYYDGPESVDVNKVHYVTYVLSRDEDGDISIDRNIGYKLRDDINTVYETSELLGQPEPQYIPIAHRQQSLRVSSPIKQDAADDQIEQISYNALFEEIFDGVSNMRFYQEFVKTREADAMISILGLVECLKRRWVIPDQLILSREHLQE